MNNPFYKLSKTIAFTDHEGVERMIEAGELFHWNQHRFVTAPSPARIKCIEVAKSKVYAAGAKMIPCSSSGVPIDLSVGGPEIEMPEPMQPERKFAVSV